jgi:hypothetical protein
LDLCLAHHTLLLLLTTTNLPSGCKGKPGTSMISKSQEETEVSSHLEEKFLEA